MRAPAGVLVNVQQISGAQAYGKLRSETRRRYTRSLYMRCHILRGGSTALRDRWYGDNRDLVKWGLLVELAARYRAKHILQVLYFRATIWKHLKIDGDTVELSPEVIQHFRKAASIAAMQCSAQIEVISDSFEKRSDYLEIVLKRIHSRKRLPGIVFLDPDTGLASSKPKLEHVLDSEVRAIWDNLSTGDVLVFYQHQTNRNGEPWMEPKKAQFERALDAVRGSAKLALAPDIARDVAFFFTQK